MKENMKTGKKVMIIGIIMFFVGLLLFYSIEQGQRDSTWRFTKDMGIFIGISGMGVVLAGIVIHIISKNEPPLKEDVGI